MNLDVVWNNAEGLGDLCFDADGNLESSDALDAEILTSLHTNLRADPGDPVPDGVEEHGYWGITYDPDETRAVRGSKLWLVRYVRGAARTVKARQWAEQSLDWLVSSGRIVSREVIAERVGIDGIRLSVTIRVASDDVRTFSLEL